MKAILNYKGFKKEIMVGRAVPEIYIAVKTESNVMGIIEKGTEDRTAPPSMKKLRFIVSRVENEGFWIFKKPVVYYSFDKEI